MEIIGIDASVGRVVEAHGSVGFSVQALVRAPDVAVTVLHVAAGGEIGRHPAPGDQLLMVTAGRGSVQGGDGSWHTTRADEDLVAITVEMRDLPLRRPE